MCVGLCVCGCVCVCAWVCGCVLVYVGGWGGSVLVCGCALVHVTPGACRHSPALLRLQLGRVRCAVCNICAIYSRTICNILFHVLHRFHVLHVCFLTVYVFLCLFVFFVCFAVFLFV